MAKRGWIPLAVKRRIWSQPCAACGHEGDTVVDHKTSVHHGGTDDEHNLQPLCKWCNHVKHKHDMSLEELAGVARRAGRPLPLTGGPDFA